MRQVDFRRLAPAPALAPFVELYWFIDWDLTTSFEQHVVSHPAVNIVITQPTRDGPVSAEIAGVGRGLFSIKLAGRGWVRGAQFRPGGFRPFHGRSVAELTDRSIPLPPVPIDPDAPDPVAAEALDRFLLSYDPQLDETTARAISLVDELRHNRSLTRVDHFAEYAGLSVRALQRLFLDCVGVSPKWVILRYRVQEAIERAGPDVSWADLAAELGYSDQAHLVRDFTATIGVSPTAYAR
jgi:AraC-like DNA-binding protein